MNVLILEPYFGGSHKLFLEGLTQHLPFDFEMCTLPARKWKWRMRLAAPFFAEQLRQTDKRYDRILCSTYVDVAALRSLAPTWVKDVPILTYFHENQFVYPVQVDDARDFHFALTNLTTALASDSLAFNSSYNLESFIKGSKTLLNIASDMKFQAYEHTIRAKSVIFHPGIDFTGIDDAPRSEHAQRSPQSPVIIWNHRWEHDKDPELFFKTLFELDQQRVKFSLIVVGESFARQPEIFDMARERLAHKIIHFGYVESKKEYHRLLKRGDFVVSTARHEFFGIAVIEAVRSGCRPLLPCRLSYPELFDKEFLYDDGEFKAGLTEMLHQGKRLNQSAARALTEHFSWRNLTGKYQEWIMNGS